MKQLIIGYFLIPFALVIPSIAYGLPMDYRTLNEGEFFADNSLLELEQDWQYTGTIPEFNAGFKDTHVDELVIKVCIPFTSICYRKVVSSDEQSVTGERIMTFTEGKNASYELSFEGEFEEETFELWDGSLYGHSNGTHNDPDAERFETSGSDLPIPDKFKSATGYKTPSGQIVEFTRQYTVKENWFNPGEFGCPWTVPGLGMKTDRCEFLETWFAASADLEAELKGIGDTTDVNPLTEEVTVHARTDRKTRFRVNNETLAMLADIQSSEEEFTVNDDGGFGPISFDFGGSLGTDASGNLIPLPTIGVSGTWNPKDEYASVSGSYSKTASMGRFVSAGNSDSYSVVIRDNPDLLASIDGRNFTSASVFSSIGMDELEVFHKVVGRAIPRSLAVKRAGLNSSRLLRVPSNKHFEEDLFFRLNLGITNESTIDILVNSLDFKLEDDDTFFDDTLATFSRDIELMLPPAQSLNFNFVIPVTAAKLNEAIEDFGGIFRFLDEGPFLELVGSGTFSFSDSFGTHTREFEVNFVPEPSSWLLISIGLFALIGLCHRRKCRSRSSLSSNNSTGD